jgi:hypothetical protein
MYYFRLGMPRLALDASPCMLSPNTPSPVVQLYHRRLYHCRTHPYRSSRLPSLSMPLTGPLPSTEFQPSTPSSTPTRSTPSTRWSQHVRSIHHTVSVGNAIENAVTAIQDHWCATIMQPSYPSPPSMITCLYHVAVDVDVILCDNCPLLFVVELQAAAQFYMILLFLP